MFKRKQPQANLHPLDSEYTMQASEEMLKRFSLYNHIQRREFIELFPHLVGTFTHLVYNRADYVNISPLWRMVNEEGNIYIQATAEKAVNVSSLNDINPLTQGERFAYHHFIIEIKPTNTRFSVVVDNVVNDKRAVCNVDRIENLALELNKAIKEIEK